MCKIIRYIITAIIFTLALGVNAQEIQTEPVQKVKGTWFTSGLYSLNIADSEFTYSRIGVMGGYLGNWGGYAKVDFSLRNGGPNASAGFTKRLTTFRSAKLSVPSTLHIYFGLGYGTGYAAGWIAETGLIFRYRQMNFIAGYGITAEFGRGFIFDGQYITQSILVGVGYTF